MAKKPKKADLSKPPQGANFSVISPLGKKIIGGGIGLVLAGFLLLSRTDPLGQNWASALSPFFLLGGYAVIAFGIVFPAQDVASSTGSSPAPAGPQKTI